MAGQAGFSEFYLFLHFQFPDEIENSQFASRMGLGIRLSV